MSVLSLSLKIITMNEEVETEKCQFAGCSRSARWNMQTGTMLWKINPRTGNYEASQKDFSADDGDNDFFCDDHARQEGIIS